MDFALNNRQALVCHKPKQKKTNKQTNKNTYTYAHNKYDSKSNYYRSI